MFLSKQAELVNHIYSNCLSVDNARRGSNVVVKGLTEDVSFNRSMLAFYENKLRELMKTLSCEVFIGGGCSLNRLYRSCTGKEWGTRQDAERLMYMAIALGIAEYPFPQELWYILPDGLPFVSVTDKQLVAVMTDILLPEQRKALHKYSDTKNQPSTNEKAA